MIRNLILTSLVIVCIHLTGVALKSSDIDINFIDKQRKALLDKGIQCSMKKYTQRNLDHLRLNSKNLEYTVTCVLEGMKEKDLQTSGTMWNILGTLFQDLGQKSQAAVCFKQAAKLTGRISSHVKEWSFIGPFVIGKIEVDGDPVEAFGGIRNVSKTRFKKNVKMFSELLPGGEIQWKHMKQAAVDKAVQITPAINWNDLVSSLGSMGITEWQGWVVGEFEVNENDLNILIQCVGVHTIYVDNIPVSGDVYHRDKYWYGVKLDSGLHTIYIKLRTKGNAQFLCKLKVPKNTLEVLPASFLPDLVDGRLFSQYLTFPIVNYHRSKYLKITKVTLSDLNSKQTEILNTLEVRLKDTSVHIAPGQIYPIILKLKVKGIDTKVISGCSFPESSWDIEFNLKFTTSAGSVMLPVQLRCRTGIQSFLFTFIDHDGSVQHAAGIQPLQDCPGGVCPTMLSLHGTTIPPQNQADSYKHMVNGEFVFGFPKAWTLAPTRHGAHNWEGPGLLTAISALESLEEMTSAADWIVNKADSKRVVYAGHSMGGHGAWHIATHYPDRALALVALAGWIKKEEYGDSNLFFRHDIATSHVEPATKFILESCIVENDADQHVTNLHGVPVVLRIGGADRTVHPWFTRRMYRLLSEQGMLVNYTEVTGKEHWWWDTVETNDGGAVNDKYLRDFVNGHIESYLSKSEETGFCTAETCDSPSSSGDQYKYQSVSFRLVCYNPALGEGMYGLKVIQQITPYRRSELQVTVSGSEINMVSRNVLRLSISSSHIRKIQWHQANLKIDGTQISSDEMSLLKEIGQIDLCYKSGSWQKCENNDVHSHTSRGPLTLGPARRIAENHFKIILGTQGSEDSQMYIQQAAVYISNLFFLTSDTRTDIVKDVDVQQSDLASSNVIVLGSVDENIHTRSLLHNTPLQYHENAISLAGCRYSSPRTGVLTLTPNGVNHLALILFGLDREGMEDVVTLAAPTIPPMTRSPFSNLVPDYVITGPDFGPKGPGGYLCTGFYGNQWEYRVDLSSCVC
ncbi:uncharacterized protein LOC132733629 [Ruditapes philippinarum]|uniref:uncharacterized protein LOC132733629 n=1 Tax=Ruditapes philippinarum TaxID=129788 RepID=UPI00295AA170|nr:uncharacterized protein LOC132733629 [Ruditapes philippinarum]